MMQNRLSSIDKKSEILIILLSISFVFTVWFFTPAEIFIRNQKDFVVGSGYVLLPTVIAAAVITVGSILLLNLILLLHKTLFMVVSRLLLGLLLAFYVQELFFNGNMTLITGDAAVAGPMASWKKYLNFALMYLITVLPLILAFCKKQYPDKKLFQIGNGYICPYLSAIIFVMQACGLLSSVAQFGLSKYDRSDDRVLSYEPVISLSSEKNIVVFLVDRFDGMYLDELLEKYPELYEEFEGFTFYQNNVSCYTSTFPSVTNMMTRAVYEEGEEWSDYFDRAWQSHTFLDDLKADGYRINLLFDNPNTYTNLSNIDTRCDNIISVDPEEYHYNYLGRRGVIPTMTAMSLGKLSPYFLKAFFLNFSADFSNSFKRLDSRADVMPSAVGTDSDLKFYDYITTHPMTADAPKYFSFIHLTGCHNEDSELSDLYDGPKKEGSFSTFNAARGDLEILFAFFRQMKERGIYDRSTIIVLGDHGHQINPYDGFDFAITTSLLIKPEDAAAQPLALDPVPELSNAYFAASVLEYAGLDHSDYGYSYSDVIENDLHPDRVFQMMLWHGLGNVSEFAQYRVTGNARDIDNWELISQAE